MAGRLVLSKITTSENNQFFLETDFKRVTVPQI